MPRIKETVFLLAIVLLLGFRTSQCDEKISQKVRTLSTNNDCKLFPWTTWFSDYLPFFFEILSCIANIVQQIANTLYFVFNTVVITCCQLITNIFSGARQIADFIEFVGHCLRTILNANYNFVSSIFAWLHKFCQSVRDMLKYIWESFVWSVSSVFKSILRLLDSVVLSVSGLFQYAGHGASTTYDTTGVMLHKSYHGVTYMVSLPGSALMTFVTTVRAIVELLIMTVINTILLVTECVLKVLWVLKEAICWTCTTTWTCITTICDNIIAFCRLLTMGVKYVISSACNGVVKLFQSVIETVLLVVTAIVKGVLSVFYGIGWSATMVVLAIIDTIMKGFNFLLQTVQHFSRGIRSLFAITSSYTPGGHWTVISISSSLLVMFSVWFVFGINILAFLFDTLERTIQALGSLLTPAAESSGFVNDSSDEDEQIPVRMESPGPSGSTPEPEECNAHDLKKKLAQEKEKNLCVVCQDRNKSVLIMPCKHLCICRRCADILMQYNSWRRRICPLCRGRIISTMDVYA